MTTLTDPESVKIKVKQAINPTDLTNAVNAADNIITSLTNVTNWTSDDYVFGLLQEIGACYAAWQILIGWDKEEYLDKSKEMKEQFETLLKKFSELPLPEDKTNQDIDIVASDYTIHQLNPDIPVFISKL